MEITEQEYNHLYDLAYKDNLTGCWNRNYLFNKIDFTQTYYIAIVDINNLKTTNDTQGHIKGDNLIKGVAEHLKQFGTTIRFGGDEFLVLIPQTDAYNFKQLQDKRYSFGWTLKTPSDNIMDTLKVADKFLYHHKKHRE